VHVLVLNTIKVDVRDLSDPAAIAAVTRTVRNAFGHLVGTWHIQLAGCDAPGHWLLRIHGAFGRHSARFWASSNSLVETVERCLRTFLQYVVTPLAARPRRPVLISRTSDAERPQPRRDDRPRRWEDAQQKAS